MARKASLTGQARQALALAALVVGSTGALAQAVASDVTRGAQLFTATAATTGKQVGNCVACHANQEALREMIRNRGAKPDDARAVRALLQRAIDGAQPGATNAKAQYRGVLGERDVQDLAAYLARASRS
jgi:cytochrome c553